MKDFWNDILLPYLKENKVRFIIVVIVMSLVQGLFHKHDWEDVQPTKSNLWTTTRSDGSTTQYIMVVQKCKKCNDYRSYKLIGESK